MLPTASCDLKFDSIIPINDSSRLSNLSGPDHLSKTQGEECADQCPKHAGECYSVLAEDSVQRPNKTGARQGTARADQHINGES